MYPYDGNKPAIYGVYIDVDFYISFQADFRYNIYFRKQLRWNRNYQMY